MNLSANRFTHASWRPLTDSHHQALDTILTAADSDGTGAFRVTAHSGCGKTWLLSEVSHQLTTRGFRTLFITAPVRQGSLGEYCADLIRSLARDVRTNPQLPGWEAWERLHRLADISPAPSAKVEVNVTVENSSHIDIDKSANVVVGDGEPQRLEAMRHRLNDQLADLAREVPLAVLIDDAHELTTTQDWLDKALGGLPVLVIEAGRPRPDDDSGQKTATKQRLTLGPMNEAETRAFARGELTEWSPGPAAAVGSLLHKGTGGYPVWVATYCQMIAAKLPADCAPEKVAEYLTGEQTDRISSTDTLPGFRRFVDDYAKTITGKDLRLFDHLCILRRITNPDSTKNSSGLTKLFGLEIEPARELYKWLHECSFMTVFDNDTDAGIRLHDYIREAAHDSRHGVRDAEAIHERAEEYYRSILNFDGAPDEKSPYRAWNRYEDPVWQRNSREWLYHAGYVGNLAFQGTTDAMIRLYLEVFFWWELLVRTRYSLDLIDDYRALLHRRERLGRESTEWGTEWLDWLDEFQANYISGWDRQEGTHPGNWRRVDEALRSLWMQGELREEPMPEVTTDRRRIQIMLCFYRGDTARYLGTGDAGSRQTALQRYQAAEAACLHPDTEGWIANWAIYWQADLLVGAEPERAARLVAGLPARVDATEDNELRIDVARLFGDLAWGRGEHALAFDIYARAVLHGFVYHLRQETFPQAPSEYTVFVYDEIRTRTERRLAEARDNGLDAVADTAQDRLRQLFSRYWEHTGTEPDNPNWFPPQPGPDALHTIEGPFRTIVEWTLENMRTELNEPLDRPLTLAD